MTKKIKYKLYDLTAKVIFLYDDDMAQDEYGHFRIPANSRAGAEKYFLAHPEEFPIPGGRHLRGLRPKGDGKWDNVEKIEEVVSSVRGFEVRALPFEEPAPNYYSQLKETLTAIQKSISIHPDKARASRSIRKLEQVAEELGIDVSQK